MLFRVAVLCLLAMPFAAFSQVHSLTLGIDVNSPYGLSEPWFTIRNALLRCPGIATVADQADRKNATGEITTKDGQLLDLVRLESLIRECGAGATLRGVEATIEGESLQVQGKWLLRFSGKEISLQPLTVLVQQDRKKPRSATDEELKAYTRLTAKPLRRVRVTGPLRSDPRLTLEVRSFESEKLNNSRGKI